MVLDGINVQRQYCRDGGLPGLEIKAGRGGQRLWFDELWQVCMAFNEAIVLHRLRCP